MGKHYEAVLITAQNEKNKLIDKGMGPFVYTDWKMAVDLEEALNQDYPMYRKKVRNYGNYIRENNIVSFGVNGVDLGDLYRDLFVLKAHVMRELELAHRLMMHIKGFSTN